MQPEQQPQQQPQQPQPAPSHGSGRKKLALFLLIGPTALLILSFLLFAVSNLVFSAAEPTPGELFAEPSPAAPFINIILFLVGGLGAFTWLPGLITGIILLASQPPQNRQQQ